MLNIPCAAQFFHSQMQQHSDNSILGKRRKLELNIQTPLKQKVMPMNIHLNNLAISSSIRCWFNSSE